MDKLYWVLTTSVFIADLAIRIGLSLRVIMQKRAASVSLAWLVIILLLPFVGAGIYLLFGETRLGERRASKLILNQPLIQQWTQALYQRVQVNWERINPECLPIDRQINATIGVPTMPDNDLEFIPHSDPFFQALIKDIRAARSSCFLEFYIWEPGGWADQVAEALLEARGRGVNCRILLDSIGSKTFLNSPMSESMRAAGIEVIEALPAGIFRVLFVRIDLRNHRKLAIIDGTIAYTGSQNLVDPRYFKQEQGVGEWVDTMVRITGPVVEVMTASFIYDWMLETHQTIEELFATADIHPNRATGNALVQVVPSGPGMAEDTLHNLFLTTIYAAREEIILTTPYFVPDTAILAALQSAAQRGVEVIIIVPEKNDSKLVHYASRARYDALVRAGVRIMAFSGGLLHAKTITIDSDFCLFGSVNLDMRSFWLNFEMTLLIYDQESACRLRELQQSYLKGARQIDCERFAKRCWAERFKENAALLVGPLL
ncbi:cardiolipin synthase [Desulfogranum mediterraneum]|uniref:cardiolipin synthase n=1 Tax=Desulfogranum mediterraneum TaxID=160661 RepID=UPI00041C9E0F|nr:cardiolipin synthase [Desulfogranum mediterraneum]